MTVLDIGIGNGIGVCFGTISTTFETWNSDNVN